LVTQPASQDIKQKLDECDAAGEKKTEELPEGSDAQSEHGEGSRDGDGEGRAKTVVALSLTALAAEQSQSARGKGKGKGKGAAVSDAVVVPKLEARCQQFLSTINIPEVWIKDNLGRTIPAAYEYLTKKKTEGKTLEYERMTSVLRAYEIVTKLTDKDTGVKGTMEKVEYRALIKEYLELGELLPESFEETLLVREVNDWLDTAQKGMLDGTAEIKAYFHIALPWKTASDDDTADMFDYADPRSCALGVAPAKKAAFFENLFVTKTLIPIIRLSKDGFESLKLFVVAATRTFEDSSHDIDEEYGTSLTRLVQLMRGMIVVLFDKMGHLGSTFSDYDHLFVFSGQRRHESFNPLIHSVAVAMKDDPFYGAMVKDVATTQKDTLAYLPLAQTAEKDLETPCKMKQLIPIDELESLFDKFPAWRNGMRHSETEVLKQQIEVQAGLLGSSVDQLLAEFQSRPKDEHTKALLTKQCAVLEQAGKVLGIDVSKRVGDTNYAVKISEMEERCDNLHDAATAVAEADDDHPCDDDLLQRLESRMTLCAGLVQQQFASRKDQAVFTTAIARMIDHVQAASPPDWQKIRQVLQICRRLRSWQVPVMSDTNSMWLAAEVLQKICDAKASFDAFDGLGPDIETRFREDSGLTKFPKLKEMLASITMLKGLKVEKKNAGLDTEGWSLVDDVLSESQALAAWAFRAEAAPVQVRLSHAKVSIKNKAFEFPSADQDDSTTGGWKHGLTESATVEELVERAGETINEMDLTAFETCRGQLKAAMNDLQKLHDEYTDALTKEVLDNWAQEKKNKAQDLWLEAESVAFEGFLLYGLTEIRDKLKMKKFVGSKMHEAQHIDCPETSCAGFFHSAILDAVDLAKKMRYTFGADAPETVPADSAMPSAVP